MNLLENLEFTLAVVCQGTLDGGKMSGRTTPVVGLN